MVDHMIAATKRSADEPTRTKPPQCHRQCARLAADRNARQGLRGLPQSPGQGTFAGASGSKGSRSSRQQSLLLPVEGSDPVALVVPEPGICPGTGKPVARTSADGFATTAPGPLPADMPAWHDHSS